MAGGEIASCDHEKTFASLRGDDQKTFSAMARRSLGWVRQLGRSLCMVGMVGMVGNGHGVW